MFSKFETNIWYTRVPPVRIEPPNCYPGSAVRSALLTAAGAVGREFFDILILSETSQSSPRPSQSSPRAPPDPPKLSKTSPRPSQSSSRTSQSSPRGPQCLQSSLEAFLGPPFPGQGLSSTMPAHKNKSPSVHIIPELSRNYPGGVVSGTAARTPPPHAPGVRMT